MHHGFGISHAECHVSCQSPEDAVKIIALGVLRNQVLPEQSHLTLTTCDPPFPQLHADFLTSLQLSTMSAAIWRTLDEL